MSAFLYSFQVWRGDKNMRELAAIMMVIAIILALHEAKTEFARSVLAMQYIYTIFGMISSIFALSKGKSELIAHG